ncbi:MAG: hypothetical protein HY689_01655 [Chloroflexi bacterium]|nr:hypothetical protein [Chloroflexota bacterium]
MQPPEWMATGNWVFPRPAAGEEALYCWVIDGCPYVLFALAVSYGELYRLRIYGYDPVGALDKWAAESNAAFEPLRDHISQEMQRLAGVWSGRLRTVDLRRAPDWSQAVKTALADGIVQIAPPPEDDAAAGQIPA